MAVVAVTVASNMQLASTTAGSEATDFFQVTLAVAMRFKRDGHAMLLEWHRVAQWQRSCKAKLQQVTALPA